MREVLSRTGVLGAGGPMTGMPPSPESAFGEASPVEGDVICALPISDALEVPETVGFCDGIQRFTVEGWIGVCPVVRASVSAAVLVRQERSLHPVASESHEFLVAPLDALDPAAVETLRSTGFPLYDVGASDRRHPTVDVRRAVQLVRQRRLACEVEVALRFRDRFPDAWLVVDGGLRGYEQLRGQSRLLGVIKSHETQYLAGRDLEVALTLPAGHRTSVFERRAAAETAVHSWYVRLWEWEGRELLYGLLRLERPAGKDVVREAGAVSQWIFAERVPLSGDNRRWDRFLYPVYQVESYLRARAGGWS